jgi:transposase
MSKVSRLEVIQAGARRRWTLAEKQRIVAES